jgi:hypothetical protein
MIWHSICTSFVFLLSFEKLKVKILLPFFNFSISAFLSSQRGKKNIENIYYILTAFLNISWEKRRKVYGFCI